MKTFCCALLKVNNIYQGSGNDRDADFRQPSHLRVALRRARG